jgi:MSHA biogenesis protein MshN
MSLINEMLNDLQKQKKGGEETKPKRLQSGVMERIPYLPLPVILGGASLILVFLVWWLAGVLSSVLFDFEPLEKPVAAQRVAVSEEPSMPVPSAVVTAEEESLTREERAAEAPVVSAQAEERPLVAPRTETPAAKSSTTTVNKVSAVKTSSVVTARPKTLLTKRKTAEKSIRVARKAPLVQKRKVVKKPKAPTQRKVVAAAPVKLNPDALPGAIMSRPVRAETKSLESRPSKALANTPYGMAEKAYLDGKWALERERENLAVQSLQHAIELYPGHLPARDLLIEIYSKAGKVGEAMFLLAEGLEIAPDYIVFKKKYARMLSDQGDYATATEVMLKGGLPSVDTDPEAHVVLASLYQRLEEPFLAAQTYRNLLVVWPQTGAFWVGLGSALESQKLPEAAVECYQKALETKNLRQDLSRFARSRLSLLN